MKKQAHKKKSAEIPSVPPIISLLKWWYYLSYIVLVILYYVGDLFNTEPAMTGVVPIMGGIVLVSLIAALGAFFAYRPFLLGSSTGENFLRLVTAYFITIITGLVYSWNFVRADQLTGTTRAIISLGSLLVYYTLYSAMKGVYVRKNK